MVDAHHIRIYDDGIQTSELSKVLALNDMAIEFIGRKSESLEDYFLKITEEVTDYDKVDSIGVEEK